MNLIKYTSQSQQKQHALRRTLGVQLFACRQKLQKKKGFQNLQLNSVWLEKSKNIMKNVIEHYCIM